MLEQGRVLAGGGNIYRRPDVYPFTVANYPPIFPAILAVVWKLVGASYSVGRLVTTTSAVLCAFLVSRIVRALTEDAFAARIAGGLFLACPWVVFWSSLVRVDFVALALSLGALLVVARAPEGRRTSYLAAALLVLACLTRQSHVLAGPLTVAMVLRRGRTTFLICFALGLGGVTGALQLVTHGAFLWNIVSANVNTFVLDHLWHRAVGLLITTWPALILVAIYLVRPPKRGTYPLVVAYLVGAGLSTLTIGKVGSHVNYFLEAAAALSLAVGVCLAQWREHARVFALVGGWAALMLGLSLFRPEGIETRLAHRQELEQLADRLRAEHGQVLADDAMGLLVLTGHPILLQPFEMTQLALMHRWDDASLVHDIEQRQFALILLNESEPSWLADRWTPRMLDAIHANYRRDEVVGDITVYRPAAGRSGR